MARAELGSVPRCLFSASSFSVACLGASLAAARAARSCRGFRFFTRSAAQARFRAEGLPEQMFPVYRCQSFLGTDDPRLLVGVGKATTASVSVVWPGALRKRTEHADLATGAHHVLRIDGTSAPASPR